MRKALDVSAAGGTIPRRVFVVTFDDGFENVYTNAWPILRELGIPATLFLATAYLDSPRAFPFDDWSAAGSAEVPAEAWRPLSTAQCQEMLASGLIELGSHTHTHAVFRGQPGLLAEELTTSLQVLQSRFGLTEVTFSFPFGVVEPDLVEVARRSGVRCSLTTQAVPVQSGSDPFVWGRFGVHDSDSPSDLTAQLDGWYSLGRSVWLRFVKPLLRKDKGREAPCELPAGGME